MLFLATVVDLKIFLIQKEVSPPPQPLNAGISLHFSINQPPWLPPPCIWPWVITYQVFSGFCQTTTELITRASCRLATKLWNPAHSASNLLLDNWKFAHQCESMAMSLHCRLSHGKLHCYDACARSFCLACLAKVSPSSLVSCAPLWKAKSDYQDRGKSSRFLPLGRGKDYQVTDITNCSYSSWGDPPPSWYVYSCHQMQEAQRSCLESDTTTLHSVGKVQFQNSAPQKSEEQCWFVQLLSCSLNCRK